jgi:adenylyltransferase/sulfurtransferase
VFGAPRGPCYRCLHPEPPPAGLIPNCADAGVLGVLPGIIGTIQATEAIKLILGVGDPLVGKLLVFDALRMRFRELRLPKDPDCPICGRHPAITSLRETGDFCETKKGDSPLFSQIKGTTGEMTAVQLKARLDAGNAPVILDVREPYEVALCRIAGSKAIPLGELPRRLGELDPADEIVVHCRSGGRSAKAVRILREAGYSRATNLSGGILRWIKDIDPQLPAY